MDNIVSSKLYRPGSVAYVSKSGGMSNELNNIISRATDGVYEGIAIGGDRYPGSSFIDHMMRFEADPQAKLLVLLGEVGGIEEYEIVKAIKSGNIKKPVVAWCIGTCSTMFTTDVQFGMICFGTNLIKDMLDRWRIVTWRLQLPRIKHWRKQGHMSLRPLRIYP
jgi:ATP citrate (pro-S)-lyase